MNNSVFEEAYPGHRLSFEILETLCEEQSDFQKIGFYRTKSHGVVFFLDDACMLTERDEYVYHEMLSHLPLFSHPNPKKVLIIGGGDLGCMNEILKHPTVEEVHLCEIDGRVIEESRKHLPWAEAAANDPRSEIQVGDGFAFLRDAAREKYYDIILVDCTDGIGNAAVPHAEQLFSGSFYALSKQALADGGIVCGQCESAFNDLAFIGEARRRMGEQFAKVTNFVATVPVYPSALWCFLFASDTIEPVSAFRRDDYLKLQQKLALKYYNDEIHQACFALPNSLREAIRQAQ